MSMPPRSRTGSGPILAGLIIVATIAVVVVLHLTSRRRLGAGRRRAALAVRIGLLSALVFALAGFQLVLPVDRLAVVFVVDLSDSVGTAGREESLAYVREALSEKQGEDVAGIVAFGGDALVERLPSDVAEIDRIASTPVRSAVRTVAAIATQSSCTCRSTVTPWMAMGWQSGTRSGVRLAAWIPAMRATARASPFGTPGPRSSSTTSGETSTRPDAVAVRTVTSFPETSTIRAAPRLSRWVNSLIRRAARA